MPDRRLVTVLIRPSSRRIWRVFRPGTCVADTIAIRPSTIFDHPQHHTAAKWA
ncbi:hypothetical protein [Rhizobium leguminosarum]|uniref:hypothetical protein n=1 Tax=Rhizobium leguminosarum TaxID=384 RepID=UPI003F9A69DF